MESLSHNHVLCIPVKQQEMDNSIQVYVVTTCNIILEKITYNEKQRSQLEYGTNDTSYADEGCDDASYDEQNTPWDDGIPGHKREIVIFMDQPATNANYSQGNEL